VSNGSRLFLDDSIDGRSREARRFRDVMADLVSHLAGEPTTTELLVLQRAAGLAVLCEGWEADVVAGKKIDVTLYNTTTNTLRRLLSDLGYARRMKEVGDSLDHYLRTSTPEGRG
jgi:hypothetical protein